MLANKSVVKFVDSTGVASEVEVAEVTLGGRRWTDALAALRCRILPPEAMRQVVVSGDVWIGGTMVPAIRLLRADGRSDLILPPGE